MRMFLAYQIRFSDTRLLGVYSTHEKAKAALRRYMNQFDTFQKYVWDKQFKRYEDPNDDETVYCICKQEVDKDLYITCNRPIAESRKKKLGLQERSE